ncbi:hypothetical protein HMPREF9080_00003 [Cardiobacterium valvarum F0432]|uniref:Uncharacterized protein n=1 Tax=Cardiobacterium valvarum F0432 TaxID=797473 RepID=G9ZB81_9GAMM|nr:hypothetical protein HMPREF9080_00003 [Cardiobacterium valvarum F0432]
MTTYQDRKATTPSGFFICAPSIDHWSCPKRSISGAADIIICPTALIRVEITAVSSNKIWHRLPQDYIAYPPLTVAANPQKKT